MIITSPNGSKLSFGKSVFNKKQKSYDIMYNDGKDNCWYKIGIIRDIDTPENYEEFEPQIYLENVDLFPDEIGIDYDRLLDAVQRQLKLEKPEISQVMQHFEDNSLSFSEEYVTIKPDKVLQCTGLKDKNGKLIYEGDIVKDISLNLTFKVGYKKCAFYLENEEHIGYFHELATAYSEKRVEVIGNIYENPELLTECE